MNFLIVGLGNIGSEYENTRHNIGFTVLDVLAKASNAVFTQDRHAFVSEIKHKGKKLVLVKPTTFMNLSGKAVSYWLQHEKIPIENLLVITDDLALPFGKVRLRPSGSDGGHNGIRNINETLGHDKYARLRFGIGNEFPRGGQVDFVLSPWAEEEQKALEPRVALACDIVKSFCTAGLQRTMSDYNNR
ncbi:MAG: aminoacyl-tRNA hydrolase [Bacteroidota bacterium]